MNNYKHIGLSVLGALEHNNNNNVKIWQTCLSRTAITPVQSYADGESYEQNERPR